MSKHDIPHNVEVYNQVFDIAYDNVAQGMDVDKAVDEAMEWPIKFGFSGPNQWHETTGNRWGVNAEKIKEALRPKPGRPLQGDEPRRMRQLSLPDSEYEQLKEVGNGNASAGVSRLLAER